MTASTRCSPFVDTNEDTALSLLTAIEWFGLPGVRHAGDLTPLQRDFIHYCWWHRQELLTPKFEE